MARITEEPSLITVHDTANANDTYIHKLFKTGRVKISDSYRGYVYLSKQEYAEWLDAQINLLKEWEEYDEHDIPF